MNGAVIGKDCMIGAGAIVTENKVIPERSLVLGVPGKIIRALTEEEISKLRDNAKMYINLAKEGR